MVATLRKPGLLRGGAFFLMGAAFSAGLSILIRALYGHDNFTHFVDADSILVIGLLAAPLFFLVGLGAFDYWFYWAAGKPTRPEDHSSHGAYSWKDYFRINTDHKVIGIQYTVHSFVFLFIGGLMAMLMRAELAAPGPPVRRLEHVQRPLQRPRVAADLPVHHPGVRRAGELRAAADDRRAGHGVPAAERAVVLAAADRRAS